MICVVILGDFSVLCFWSWILLCLRMQGELWGWIFFFIGVAAVGFGSSYYHLKPNDARLVWDRLPVSYCCYFCKSYVCILVVFFLIQDLKLCIDDYFLHFHHCHFYYWKSRWEERNSVNCSSAPGWRHQHSVLGVSILLVTRIVHSHACWFIDLFAYSCREGVAFFI